MNELELLVLLQYRVQPLKHVLFLSSVFSRAECIDNPPVLLNSIDASFQVRLQELEEKQEVQ